MRLVVTLFVLAIVSPAFAQETVEDTTSAWRYFPLHVGDAWEYSVLDDQGGAFSLTYPVTRLVRADTLVDGVRYALVEERRHYTGAFPASVPLFQRYLARFDTVTARVMLRGLGETEENPVACPLDLPFGTQMGDCGSGVTAITDGGYDQEVEIGGQTVTATRKFIGTRGTFDGGRTYVADIGQTGYFFVEVREMEWTIQTVRIEGQYYGDPPSDRFPGIPDPTDPALYFPLHAGDEWHYHLSGGLQVFWDRWTFRRVVRDDSTFDGRTYSLVRDSIFEQSSTTGGHLLYLGVQQYLLRYDASSARVFGQDGGGEYPYSPRLNADFGWYDDGQTWVDTLLTPFGAAKLYASLGAEAYLAGVGQVHRSGDFYSDDLVYYYVGGLEGGTPLVVVSREEPPEAGRLALSVAPNPATSRLGISVEGPGLRTLEAFDVLGRRVLSRELADPRTIEVDVSAWAPGLYVVRVEGEGESASRRVVVR